MNYNITPIIEGSASNFPLRPQAAPIDEVLAALKTEDKELTPEQKREFGDFRTSEEARRSVSLYCK